VLFHEMIPEGNLGGTANALSDCDLFVAIGTSGTVYPAATFVERAFRRGARTVYINLESLAEGDSFYAEEYLGKAEELVPRLLGGGTVR